MLLIPARIKQIKDEGRREGYKEGLEEVRQERNKRLYEAAERFGYMDNGVRVLRFTPEVRRFLAGEDVDVPVQRWSRQYRRRRRRG